MAQIFIAFHDKNNHPLVGRIVDRLKANSHTIFEDSTDTDPGMRIEERQSLYIRKCDAMIAIIEYKGFRITVWDKIWGQNLYNKATLQLIKQGINRSDCLVIPVSLNTDRIPYHFLLPREWRKLVEFDLLTIRNSQDFDTDIKKLLRILNPQVPKSLSPQLQKNL